MKTDLYIFEVVAGVEGTNYNINMQNISTGALNQKIESENGIEPGLMMFDTVSMELLLTGQVLTMLGESVSGLYDKIYGIRIKRGSTNLFEGVIDNQSIEWSDNNTVSFDVYEWLYVLNRYNFDNARTLTSFGDHPVIPNPDEGTVTIVMGGNETNMSIDVQFEYSYINLGPTPLFSPGQIIKRLSDGGLFFITKSYTQYDSGLGRYINHLEGPADNDDITGSYDLTDLLKPLSYHGREIYGVQVHNAYTVSDAGKNGTGIYEYFDATKCITAIINKAAPNRTVINYIGTGEVQMELSWWRQTILNNVFGKGALDALKMLANSSFAYVFINNNGNVVIQGRRGGINYNSAPVRTISENDVKINKGTKITWNTVIDAAKVTLTKADGSTLTAEYSRYPNSEDVEKIEREFFYIDGYDANDILSIYWDIYAYPRREKNYQLFMNSENVTWQLLDKISLSGIDYMIIEMTKDYKEDLLELRLVQI